MGDSRHDYGALTPVIALVLIVVAALVCLAVFLSRAGTT